MESFYRDVVLLEIFRRIYFTIYDIVNMEDLEDVSIG